MLCRFYLICAWFDRKNDEEQLRFMRFSLDDVTYTATTKPGLEERAGRLSITRLLDPPFERRRTCWETVQWNIPRSAVNKVRMPVGLQPPWLITASQNSTYSRNNIAHYTRWSPTRTTSSRSCQTAAAAINCTLVLNICHRHRAKVGHCKTSARRRWKRKLAWPRWRGLSMTGPFLSFPSVARTLHLPALRAWNIPVMSCSTRHR